MSEYRRFVSYIYSYEKGVKGNNIGFVRVEEKNKVCKLHIHLSSKSLGNRILPVFTFMRKEGKVLPGKAGEILMNKGSADGEISFDSHDVPSLHCPFSEIKGLLFPIHIGKYFGTQWDEEALIIEEKWLYQQDSEITMQRGEKKEEKKLRGTLSSGETFIKGNGLSLVSAVLEKDLVAAEVINEAEEVNNGTAAEQMIPNDEQLKEEPGKKKKGEQIEKKIDATMDASESEPKTDSNLTTIQSEEVNWGEQGKYIWVTEEEAQNANFMDRAETRIDESPKDYPDWARPGEPMEKLKQKTRMVASSKQKQYKEKSERQGIESSSSNESFCGENVPEELSGSDIEENITIGNNKLQQKETYLEAKKYEEICADYPHIEMDNFFRLGMRRFGHVMIGKLNGSEIIGIPGMLCPREKTVASGYGYTSFYPKGGGSPLRGSFGYWYKILDKEN